MRDRVAAAALLAAATLLAGCAGLPTGGAVHLGRALPAAGGLGDDPDVRVLPPSWHPGLEPVPLVNGFLRAMVNNDDDYAIARSYLTPAASARWHASAGVTTYDVLSLQRVGAGTGHSSVQLRASRIGHLDQRGDYEPLPGTMTTTIAVVRAGGSWRIDRVPDGVLLSASDLQRSFSAAEVYYLNRTGTSLVPEQVLLQNSQRGVATALVAALLDGPGSWLAPAVRSAAPARTALIGNVPVHDDGVADVNLSPTIRQASAVDLVGLSAQLVWTLRQVSDVTAVRLLVDGAPLPVPGAAARQPVSSWARFDPSAPSSSHDVIYVRNGHLAAAGGGSAALARSDPGAVVSVARSRDGATLAVVQRYGAQQRLLTGEYGKALKPRLVAATMTPPTFDADGDVLTVAAGPAGRRVVAVTPQGTVHRIAADPALTGQPVTQLRVARDGARVAAVVGSGRLLVGRVDARAGLPSLTGFRDVAPTLRGIRGVTWVAADAIVVTAAGPDGQRQVEETDPDGYATRTLPLDRLRGRPVDVSGAPGQPLLVVTDRGVIWAEAGGWRRIAVGTAAVHS